MPLKKFCRKPGCKQVVAGGGYCDQHQQPAHSYDQQRGTAAQRGYGHEWRKARAVYLQQHPLCAECERAGRVQAATVVDHVVPYRGDRTLFWDRANWQPLCATHHSEKTAKEDGGFGNPGLKI
ncbi:HNH endonuclease signature motif containing protein [Saccharibacillus sacchari]|uniref:HNH endonuclease signature motif containing protein n=1 Tax=Saccharibacillus sacchari TaxID=456493 RepID=A0ACC6PID9_9BACL